MVRLPTPQLTEEYKDLNEFYFFVRPQLHFVDQIMDAIRYHFAHCTLQSRFNYLCLCVYVHMPSPGDIWSSYMYMLCFTDLQYSSRDAYMYYIVEWFPIVSVCFSHDHFHHSNNDPHPCLVTSDLLINTLVC